MYLQGQRTNKPYLFVCLLSFPRILKNVYDGTRECLQGLCTTYKDHAIVNSTYLIAILGKSIIYP